MAMVALRVSINSFHSFVDRDARFLSNEYLLPLGLPIVDEILFHGTKFKFTTLCTKSNVTKITNDRCRH